MSSPLPFWRGAEVMYENLGESGGIQGRAIFSASLDGVDRAVENLAQLTSLRPGCRWRYKHYPRL